MIGLSFERFQNTGVERTMITPRFDVKQDPLFVYITIRVPYVRVEGMDFDVDGKVFKLSVSPYFLRLTFSHGLVADGREKADYDYEKGTLTVCNLYHYEYCVTLVFTR